MRKFSSGNAKNLSESSDRENSTNIELQSPTAVQPGAPPMQEGRDVSHIVNRVEQNHDTTPGFLTLYPRVNT